MSAPSATTKRQHRVNRNFPGEPPADYSAWHDLTDDCPDYGEMREACDRLPTEHDEYRDTPPPASRPTKPSGSTPQAQRESQEIAEEIVRQAGMLRMQPTHLIAAALDAERERTREAEQRICELNAGVLRMDAAILDRNRSIEDAERRCWEAEQRIAYLEQLEVGYTRNICPVHATIEQDYRELQKAHDDLEAHDAALRAENEALKKVAEAAAILDERLRHTYKVSHERSAFQDALADYRASAALRAPANEDGG